MLKRNAKDITTVAAISLGIKQPNIPNRIRK